MICLISRQRLSRYSRLRPMFCPNSHFSSQPLQTFCPSSLRSNQPLQTYLPSSSNPSSLPQLTCLPSSSHLLSQRRHCHSFNQFLVHHLFRREVTIFVAPLTVTTSEWHSSRKTRKRNGTVSNKVWSLKKSKPFTPRLNTSRRRTCPSKSTTIPAPYPPRGP
jgi:hypothetical protein